MITGDRRFGPGSPRYELQKSAARRLEVLYWGSGALWPRLPNGKFDVVTAQDPFFRALFGWYVARKLGTRFNVQLHADLSAQSFPKHILARIVLRHADSIRVVSQKLKTQVERIGARAPVTVLPVFIDVSRFRGIERRPENLVLWVGRFEPEKDPLFALEIMKKMPDAKLVMLGNGSLAETLKEKARGLPVEFPGWQDPLPYLSRAAAVLSTSPAESWGESIVEALAAGVPVVSLDVGIAREAGARVVTREKLAETTAQMLRSTARGTLRLTLPSKKEWVKLWRASLQ